MHSLQQLACGYIRVFLQNISNHKNACTPHEIWYVLFELISCVFKKPVFLERQE